MLSQAWPAGRTRRQPVAPIIAQFLPPPAALEAFTLCRRVRSAAVHRASVNHQNGGRVRTGKAFGICY